MPNKPQNDDLITEVLNKDPKYVETRNQKEHDFKHKHKLNSSFGLFYNRFHWFKFRYAIPALCLFVILGISNYTIQNAKKTSNMSSNQVANLSNTSERSESNVASDSLIAKAPAPFLPMPGSNELLDNNIMNNKIKNPAILDSKDLLNGGAASEAPKTSTNQNSTLDSDKNKPNLDLKTTVKSEDGSSVTFSYDQNVGIVRYLGTVIGNDACTFLDIIVLEKQEAFFALKYKLKRTGDICAQVIKEIPISGSLNIKLDELQLVTYEKLFKIEKSR